MDTITNPESTDASTPQIQHPTRVEDLTFEQKLQLRAVEESRYANEANFRVNQAYLANLSQTLETNRGILRATEKIATQLEDLVYELRRSNDLRGGG